MLSSEFDDIEEATQAIAHESLCYRQLDAGPIQVVLEVKERCDLSVMRAALNRRVDGSGFIEPGRFLFEFCLAGDEAHIYSGQEVSPGDLYLADEGGGGHQLFKPGFDILSLNFSKRLLLAHSGEPLKVPAQGMVHQLDPKIAEAVVRLGSEFLRGQLNEVQARHLADESARLLCGSLPQVRQQPYRRVSVTERAQLAGEARELLVECPDMTLGDICSEIGLSSRNLRRLFTAAYGTSPGQYRLAVRLGSVRSELKRSPHRKGVIASVAARHGFWHMGRFGAQYRRQFGESPSETLLAQTRGPSQPILAENG